MLCVSVGGVYMHMWRSEFNVRCNSQHIFWDKVYHWTWNLLIGLGWLAQKPLEISPSSFPSTVVRHGLPCPVFTWMLGVQTEVLMFLWVALYWWASKSTQLPVMTFKIQLLLYVHYTGQPYWSSLFLSYLLPFENPNNIYVSVKSSQWSLADWFYFVVLLCSN